MKILKWYKIILIILPIIACKNASPSVAPTISEDQWIELINGKDFTGWKASEVESTWSVVDGMFQAVGKRSHLFYTGEELKDSFVNFEIDVMVKTFRLANSGIYFHTHYQQEGWPIHGMEIQVNNTHIGEGDYMELKKMASLYGFRNIYKTFGKDSVWMNVKARVEKNRVQVWLDGLKTVDYLQPEIIVPGVMRLSKGTFCLQGHDSLSKMQYKSFKVRRLPDETVSDMKAPVLGAWYDSLTKYQSRQYAFIDLNPHTDLEAEDLAQYVYATGINAALVMDPAHATNLSTASGKPLFTGIRVNASTIAGLNPNFADYIIGESNNLTEAKYLLFSGKIDIWSHRGEKLNSKNVSGLFDLAKKNRVAIEIDNEAKSPSIDLIKLAKSKGCKFTFAGLIPVNKLETSLYLLDAIKEGGLTYKDFYIPKW